ncbi:MAG: cysteine--tRNA ligase [candidate division WWE3 bacterium]|nr:cysteine--tRNA ligase [candidate division WWE3 bacterium]
MKLYNSLTRQKDEFIPINPPHVGLYTCGPTVYFYPQIGNWRTFVFEDILRRTLEYNGYEVNHVMNATDVGHLTGDNIGDADLGEDRMEKAAKSENKTAWDIADFYIKDFIDSRQKLNIIAPTHFMRATDYIPEQIDLIKRLEVKGLTYTTKSGVYFDVAKWPEYGKLGGQKLVDKRVATREELVEDPEKRHPYDFALWKFSPTDVKRQMEWESPWGRGFPGWHIECSAMSMKYLGESFDIHTGGIDHIAIHHANEIAQSEGATGKQFAKYWLHAAFLQVDGGRMGKSLGNAYTLADIVAKGFSPLALRYFYLTAHYRKPLNFTWEALQSAAQSLDNLINRLQTPVAAHVDLTSSEVASYKARFVEAISDDFNMPQALAVVQELVSKHSGAETIKLILDFDRVLGLGLHERHDVKVEIPVEVASLLKEREQARSQKDFRRSDELRDEIKKLGFEVKDTTDGQQIHAHDYTKKIL